MVFRVRLKVLVAGMLCLALAGCFHRIVPGTVTNLNLPVGSGILAASLGHDGRLWYAFGGPALEPRLGSVGIYGDPVTYTLPTVSHNYSFTDVAVARDGTIWTVFECICGQPGYALFSGREHSLKKLVDLGLNSSPEGVSLAADGSAWIAERNPSAVVHVVHGGRLSTIQLGDPTFAPIGLIAMSKGVVVAGESPGKLALVEGNDKVRWLALPNRASHASFVAVGPDDRIWVAEIEANKILSIDSRGVMHEYVIPTRDSKPSAVAVASHGTVWFIENDADRLGQITPDGTVREAMLPNGVSSPVFLYAGPEDMLYVLGSTTHWFGAYRTFVVARIPAATAFP